MLVFTLKKIDFSSVARILLVFFLFTLSEIEGSAADQGSSQTAHDRSGHNATTNRPDEEKLAILSGLQEVEFERQKNSSLLLRLMEDPSASSEMRRINQRQLQLARQQINLRNQLISLSIKEAKPVVSNHASLEFSDKSHPEEDLQDEVLVEKKYIAQIKFLGKLLNTSITKINEKLEKSPYVFDNGHFTFLKKKRKLSKSARAELQIKFEQVREKLNLFQQELGERIERLPKIEELRVFRVNPLEFRNCLEEIEKVRKEIITRAYKFESLIETIVGNLSCRYKMDTLVHLILRKLQISKLPQASKRHEVEELSNKKRQIYGKIEKKANDLFNQTENIVTPQQLSKALNKEIKAFELIVDGYLLDKIGSEQYLNSIKSKLKCTLHHEKLISLEKKAREVAKNPPFPIHESLYWRHRVGLEKYLRFFQDHVLEETRKDLAKLQELPPISHENPSKLASSQEFRQMFLKKFSNKYEEQIKNEYLRLSTCFKQIYLHSLCKTAGESFRAELGIQRLPNWSKKSEREQILITQLLQKEEEEEALTRERIQGESDHEKLDLLHSDFIKKLGEWSKQVPKPQTVQDLATRLHFEINSISITDSLHVNPLRLAQVIRLVKKSYRDRIAEVSGESNSFFSLCSQRQVIKYKNTLNRIQNSFDEFKCVFEALLRISQNLLMLNELDKGLRDLNIFLKEDAVQQPSSSDFCLMRETLLGIYTELEMKVRSENVEKIDFSEWMGSISELDTNVKKLLDTTGNSLSQGVSSLEVNVLSSSTNLYKSFLRILRVSHSQVIQEEAYGNRSMETLVNLDKVLKGFISTLVLNWAEEPNTTLNFPDELKTPEHRFTQPKGEFNGLIGLRNFGNTCYLNSILKAIALTPLQRLFYPNFYLAKGKNEGLDEYHLRVNFKKQMNLFLSTLNENVFPDSVINQLHSNVVDSFGELFRAKLQSSASSDPNGEFLSWKSEQYDVPEVLGWILDAFSPQSEISKIGMKSFSKTETAALTSSNIEEYLLPLALPQENLSIQNLLDRSFQSSGASSQSGLAQITHAPELLLIQLNRFEYDRAIQSVRKIFKQVEPTSFVILTEYNSRPKIVKYRLKGVICHLGDRANEGHYTYISFKNSNIIIHDDETVSSRLLASNDTMNDLMAKNAYVLFYERL